MKIFRDPTKRFLMLPNEFADFLMPTLPPNAFKIIFLIYRNTRGWNKDVDQISFSQIMEGTGIGSTHTVRKALDYLVDNGFIFAQANPGAAYNYRLNSDYELTIAETTIAETAKVPQAETAKGTMAETANTKDISLKDKNTMAQSAESILIQPGDDRITRLNKTQKTSQALIDHLKTEQDDDLFANVSEPPQVGIGQQPTKKKLDGKDAAHLLAFGTLPDDNPDPEIYVVRQELQAAGWEIHSTDVELAIVYFVLAVRGQHPGFKIPKDTGSRKHWYQSVNAHLANYELSELQDLYKRAIIKMKEKNLSYWVPGSLTNWGLPEVANETRDPARDIDISKGFYV